MGLPDWRSSAAVRMSFGPMMDDAFIAAACRRIERCGAALRADCWLPSSGVAPLDGVTRLASDGACSYLVVDAASRGCVVIDPREALAGRIDALVRGQRLTVRAVLATDGAGWPDDSERDGTAADAITLGNWRLVRVPHGYLLGPASDAGDVRFAFADQPLPAALLNPDTVLCPASDPHNMLCSTPGAAAPVGDVAELAADALEHFLLSHPDALLVDVREGYEHAGGAGARHGRSLHSVPLSRLPDAIAGWLRGARPPLLFVCRGGARSARAAHCLRRLGYKDAWYLAGGLALTA